MHAWWVLWVIASVVGNWLLLSLFGNAGDSMESLATRNYVSMFVSVTFMVADVLVVILVWQITMAQERKFQELTHFQPT